MDPRLWQWLNSPPGELFIRSIALSHTSSTLTLECEAYSDVYPGGKTFRLRFMNCRDIRWQAMDTHPEGERIQALGMYLGEHSHHRPAVMYTGAVEMSVLYSKVQIDG